MADLDLKPCPFCGGEAAFINETRTIKCKHCGGAFICTNPLIAVKEVAEAWNRRDETPEPPKEKEAICKILNSPCCDYAPGCETTCLRNINSKSDRRKENEYA